MAGNWSPWTLEGVIVRITHAARNGQKDGRVAMCGLPLSPNWRRTPSRAPNCAACRAALSS